MGGRGRGSGSVGVGAPSAKILPCMPFVDLALDEVKSIGDLNLFFRVWVLTWAPISMKNDDFKNH